MLRPNCCGQDVYRSTWGFLKLETEKMCVDEAKEKQTKTGTLNRQTRKQAVLGVLRWAPATVPMLLGVLVVLLLLLPPLPRLVLTRGRKHLPWASILQDLLTMLEMPGMRRHHAPGVSRLLLEAVSCPLVRALLRVGEGAAHQWGKLLEAVAGLVQEAPPGVEGGVVGGLLHAVLRWGPEYGCMHRELVLKSTWKLVSEKQGMTR